MQSTGLILLIKRLFQQKAFSIKLSEIRNMILSSSPAGAERMAVQILYFRIGIPDTSPVSRAIG